MSNTREFWIDDDHLVYTYKPFLENIIHVREVLPDSIQGEKLFELSQTNYKLLQHIETLTAKVKRYEEVLNDLASACEIESRNRNENPHDLVIKARAALNQGEGKDD